MKQLLLPQHGPVVLLLSHHLLVERVGGQLLRGEPAKVHLEILGPVLEDLARHGWIGALLDCPCSSSSSCMYRCEWGILGNRDDGT